MAIKHCINEFLGPEKLKWVQQEYMGGVILPVNKITMGLFDYVFNPSIPNDAETTQYLKNVKFIWVGTEEDYNNNIDGTKYYQDEVLYVLVPTRLEELFNK